MSTVDVLSKLFETIEARRKADPESSYTAKLFSKGRAKIAQKLGEEATEAVIEAIQGDKQKLAQESADLLYHLLVVWADAGMKPADVWAVIEDRMAYSGNDKKRARKGGD
jgi:phosphoribosyl-ATP pyrophosphohydrolase